MLECLFSNVFSSTRMAFLVLIKGIPGVRMPFSSVGVRTAFSSVRMVLPVLECLFLV